MNREPKSATALPAARTWNRRQWSSPTASACRGRMALSLGFYLGTGALLVLLVAGVVLFPAPAPLTDQHANPTPATQLPAQVLISSGSNLYHAAAACPYKHQNSKLLAALEAMQQGLVPCPFCIGNSSAQLTPSVVAPRDGEQKE